MAQLPDQLLAWLYSVLHDYTDPQRTYTDIARTLLQYPSLRPATKIYTSETGTQALLLTLSGTLPINFRGANYNFPLELSIPKEYPNSPPVVFVTPERGSGLEVRAGQHVGPDGRVYHSYLRDWEVEGQRGTGVVMVKSVGEFLGILEGVFGKEPPVVQSRQQQQQQQQQEGLMAGAPRIPPKRLDGTAGSEHERGNWETRGDVPPPRPPKPGEPGGEAWPARTSSSTPSQGNEDEGPPLPPLPHERLRGPPLPSPPPVQSPRYASMQSPQYPPSQQYQPDQPYDRPGPSQPRPPSYQNGTPRAPQSAYQLQQQRGAYQPSPVSPLSATNGYTREASMDDRSMRTSQQLPPMQTPQQQQTQLPPQHYPQPQQRQYPLRQAIPQYRQSQPTPQQPQPAKQPAQDLLTDPFDITIPNPASTSAMAGPTQPAPPIPPNPEKQHLLSALSHTLTQQAQQTLNQNLAYLPALQAQNSALHLASQNLENEVRALSHLDNQISQNEAILRQSIRDCDAVIASARQKALPPIDEVLVPTSVVAGQLWRVCAEAAAAKEVGYALMKGLEGGRVEGRDFVRGMRGLGREGFLREVVARKGARGMGLEV